MTRIPRESEPTARCVVCGCDCTLDGDGRCDVCREQDAQPFVCPGCHAVGGERCASWCPDAAIEGRAEEESDDCAGDDDDEESDQ